ncbi:MAG TPA: ATP-binding protein [Planctomycetota bacterium]|nr:ATP-binding protein [Planctomycetota bacterium]
MNPRHPLANVEVRREQDVVTARARARQVAEILGFANQDQVRIGTAVSELARNAFRYAGGGSVHFGLDPEGDPALVIRVSDHGPGIADLARVLDGHYVSRTGMGIGLTGTRRLMDRFLIDSAPGRGTDVTIAKLLPRGTAVDADYVARVGAALAGLPPGDPISELARQNRDLIVTLAELRSREDDLSRINRELTDTNRGVLALHAELEQRAEELKRAVEVKSRFFSFMSHEFRTPVNSILALARLLADRVDGDLTSEQEKQVGFIRSSATDLATLVNDLLDIAKVEAGRITLRPVRFAIDELFGGLKGVLRPLIPADRTVALIFEEVEALPELETDEAKVAQILRNLIGNALKFTEAGEVRVRARRDGEMIVIEVSDTGIGIAPEQLEAVFRDFAQVENRLSLVAKGTGLGLSLSRKLAALLGGTLAATSVPERGSTFTLRLPMRIAGTPVDGEATIQGPIETVDAAMAKVLIIDDDPAWRYVLRGLMSGAGIQVYEAGDGADGLDVARVIRPQAILLDLAMPIMDGFETYANLREDRELATTPVIVCSSRVLSPTERERLTGAVALLDKTTRGRDADLLRLADALARAGVRIAAEGVA